MENIENNTPETANGLNLWELMRKDADPPADAGADDNDRVLSSSRPSIWDLE